jgi:hypothetical protein
LKITRTHKFFDTLLLTLLVFSGGGLLFVFNRNLFSVILLLVALFTIVFMGHQIKKSIFNASLFTLFIFLSLIILNYIVAPGSQKFLKYGFHLMNITSCVLILTHFRNNRSTDYFLGIIRWILKIILYFSVLNFLAYFIIKDNLTPADGGWNNEYITDTFNFIFFYNPEKHAFNFFGIELIRNQGWFWEPGVNQVYLNILLYLEGFVFKRGKWIIPLIVFAIITTYSTTGIFLMIIILFFIFIKSIKRNPIIYIFLGILITYPLYYLAKSNIENKSIENASSMNKRIFDLVQPLAIAADNPITGIGLDIEHFQRYRSEYHLSDETQSLLTTETTEKGSSNSVTFLLAATGFPMSLFLLYCLFKQNLFTYRKGIFMSIIIISVLSEPLLLRPFFLILIVSGMYSFFNKFTK